MSTTDHRPICEIGGVSGHHTLGCDREIRRLGLPSDETNTLRRIVFVRIDASLT